MTDPVETFLNILRWGSLAAMLISFAVAYYLGRE